MMALIGVIEKEPLLKDEYQFVVNFPPILFSCLFTILTLQKAIRLFFFFNYSNLMQCHVLLFVQIQALSLLLEQTKKDPKQVGAELCQDQFKFGLV
jgi:hypothetical protein